MLYQQKDDAYGIALNLCSKKNHFIEERLRDEDFAG